MTYQDHGFMTALVSTAVGLAMFGASGSLRVSVAAALFTVVGGFFDMRRRDRNGEFK